MGDIISACGVICSRCGAYNAASKGRKYQQQVAEAWERIYGYKVDPATLTCGGCLGPDRDVFPTSLHCAARRCCLGNGLKSCGTCSGEACDLLEKAQAQWDGVPGMCKALSPEEFEKYARPYCGHRERIAALRHRS